MKDEFVILIADYLNMTPYATYTAIMGKRCDRQAILAKRLYINMMKYKGKNYKYIAEQINCSYATTYKQVSNYHLNNLIKEYEKSRIKGNGRHNRV